MKQINLSYKFNNHMKYAQKSKTIYILRNLHLCGDFIPLKLTWQLPIFILPKTFFIETKNLIM